MSAGAGATTTGRPAKGGAYVVTAVPLLCQFDGQSQSKIALLSLAEADQMTIAPKAATRYVLSTNALLNSTTNGSFHSQTGPSPGFEDALGKADYSNNFIKMPSPLHVKPRPERLGHLAILFDCANITLGIRDFRFGRVSASPPNS